MQQGRGERLLLLGEAQELGFLGVRPGDEDEIGALLGENLIQVRVEACNVAEYAHPELRGKKGQVEMENVVVQRDGGLHFAGDVIRLRLARLGEHPVVRCFGGERGLLLGEGEERSAEKEGEHDDLPHTASSARS